MIFPIPLIPNRLLDRRMFVLMFIYGFPNVSVFLPASCQPLCLDEARYTFDKGDCQSARRQDEITLDSNDRFGIMREKKYECP